MTEASAASLCDAGLDLSTTNLFNLINPSNRRSLRSRIVSGVASMPWITTLMPCNDGTWTIRIPEGLLSEAHMGIHLEVRPYGEGQLLLTSAKAPPALEYRHLGKVTARRPRQANDDSW